MATKDSTSWFSYQWNPGLRHRLLDGVVITVMTTIVTAILWPVYASEKRGPAISHGKACGIAVAMYSDENDDRLPIASRWMDLTAPYANDPSIFHSLALNDPGQWGFAFRRIASGRRTEDITTPPNRLAIVFDSIDTRWNANGGLSLLPHPSRSPEGNIVIFADGHAYTLPNGDKRIQ